jgi:hypothetical protein
MSTIVELSAAAHIDTYISPYFTIKAGGLPNYDAADVMPNSWIRKRGGQDYSGEKKLFRGLITEAYNKLGTDVSYFIISYDTQYDRIWGEDDDRRFVRRFDVMCWFPLASEEKMWTKFAIEGIDNFSMYISKEHFSAASTYGHNLVAGNIGPNTYSAYYPKAGDILMSNYNEYIYEVLTVKENAFQALIDKHYCWELILKPFRNRGMMLESSTSASMAADVDIAKYVNANSIFDISSVIASAASAVEYDPATNETDPRDPFSGF